MSSNSKFIASILAIFILSFLGCSPNDNPKLETEARQLKRTIHNAPSFIFSDTIVPISDKSKAVFSGETWSGLPSAYHKYTEKQKRDPSNYIPYSGLIVGLYNIESKTLYSDTIFNNDGKFSIEVPEGEYLFEVLNSKSHNEKMTANFFLNAGEKRERIYVYH